MASVIIFLGANCANSHCCCSQAEQREMKRKGFNITISHKERSQHILFSQDTKEHFPTRENVSPTLENLPPC